MYSNPKFRGVRHKLPDFCHGVHKFKLFEWSARALLINKQNDRLNIICWLAFHRCDKARKLNKLNKLNRGGKAIYTETIAAPSTAFELGSSHARNAPDGTQNCLILRSASRTNRVIRLFEEFDAEFNICRAVFFARASRDTNKGTMSTGQYVLRCKPTLQCKIIITQSQSAPPSQFFQCISFHEF